MTEISVKLLTPTAKMPVRAHEYDAGWDIHVDIPAPWILEADEIVIIPTGIAVGIPPGYEIQIRTRSGMAAKHGLQILNSPGTIDSGFTDGIHLIIRNSSQTAYPIQPGERLGQMVVQKLPEVSFKEVDELPVYGSRGAGGFGSSGKL